MARVLFLSEETLKQYSILQDNVDMKVVTPTIYTAQNLYIKTLLGTALYNAVSDAVEAFVQNATPIPDNYKTLLDEYLTDALIEYVKVELVFNMNYKYFNKSIGVQNADNMIPATLDELREIRNESLNRAQWFAERATKFLLAHYTDYPLYLNQPNANIDTIWPNRTNYESGMVLDGSGCCMGKYNFLGIPIAPPEIRCCNDIP